MMESGPATAPGFADEAGSQESWPQRFYFFGCVIRLEANVFLCLLCLISVLVPFFLLHPSTLDWSCGCHGNNSDPIPGSHSQEQRLKTIPPQVLYPWRAMGEGCLLNSPRIQSKEAKTPRDRDRSLRTSRLDAKERGARILIQELKFARQQKN